MEQDILDTRVIGALLVFNVLLALFLFIYLPRPFLLTGSPWLEWVYRSAEFIYWSCVFVLFAHWLQLWYFPLILTILYKFYIPLFLCHVGAMLIACLLRYVGTVEQVVVRFETVTLTLVQAPLMLLCVLSCCITMPTVVSLDVLSLMLLF